MTDVSVPCDRCHAPVRFGVDACPACQAPLSSELRLVLEERLEATSSDYRSMRNRVREVGAILVVLGAFRVVLSTFLRVSTPMDTLDAPVIFATNVLFGVDLTVGAGMMGAALFVRRHPRSTLVAVLASWGVTELLVALLFPLALLMGLVGKLVMLAVFVRAFVAAGQAEALRAGLAKARTGSP